MTSTFKLLRLFEKAPGIYTMAKLVEAGAYANLVRNLVKDGVLEEISRGVYGLQGQDLEHYEMKAIASMVPNAVFCLFSALDFHNIGTQRAFDFHIALPSRQNPPQREDFSIKSYHYRKVVYKSGIEKHSGLQVYSIPKTVADCFMYRNKIGLDVALEALQDVLKNKKATIAEIIDMADICRVKKVMMPYIEAFSL